MDNLENSQTPLTMILTRLFTTMLGKGLLDLSEIQYILDVSEKDMETIKKELDRLAGGEEK